MGRPMDAVKVNRHVAIPLAELTFRFSRSGGPGGQNVNVRDTRVELVFDLARSPALGPRQRARAMERLAGRLDADGRLRIVASEERSQAQNRARAVERFREVMAETLRPDPPPRRPTRPTPGGERRRLESKKARAKIKRLRGAVPDE